MSICMSFADGSNPLVYFNLTDGEVKNMLKRWRHSWVLDVHERSGILWVYATAKKSLALVGVEC